MRTPYIKGDDPDQRRDTPDKLERYTRITGDTPDKLELSIKQIGDIQERQERHLTEKQ
jgi:hypothetical protein